MSDPEPFDEQLSREQAVELCGFKGVSSLDTYRRRGVFPPEDGMIGRSPWWWRSTLVKWQENRPGRGDNLKRLREETHAAQST